MFELLVACIEQISSPGIEVVVGAITPTVLAFLVMAVRIRAEQHAPGLQCSAQLSQDTRQFTRRHMKQRCVREDAVKMRGRQIKSEEILLPYFTSSIGARHGHKGSSALQADRCVLQL